MGNSLFLAKFLGAYLTIVGIGIFFNPKNCQRIAHEYGQSAALIYLGGVLALFFGLLITLFHNVWVADWMVIITLFGWLGLFKGTWLIIFPGSIAKFVQRYQGSTRPLKIQASILFLLGIFLMLKGCGGI